MKLISREDHEKYTALNEEIKMHKPRTDWVGTLVGLALLIGLTFCVYGVLMVIAAIKVIN